VRPETAVVAERHKVELAARRIPFAPCDFVHRSLLLAGVDDGASQDAVVQVEDEDDDRSE
jgi:hypothetical protein